MKRPSNEQLRVAIDWLVAQMQEVSANDTPFVREQAEAVDEVVDWLDDLVRTSKIKNPNWHSKDYKEHMIKEFSRAYADRRNVTERTAEEHIRKLLQLEVAAFCNAISKAKDRRKDQ